MPPPVVLVRLFVWLSVLGIVEMTRPFWAAKNKRDFQTCTNSFDHKGLNVHVYLTWLLGVS